LLRLSTPSRHHTNRCDPTISLNRIDDALIISYGEMKIPGKWSYESIAQDIKFDGLVNLVRAVVLITAGRVREALQQFERDL